MNSKILIIADGKKPNIIPVYQYLVEHGYVVLVSYDGTNGFNLTRREKPDLILIDSVLSGLNGYQICSLIKNDIKYEDIIVVIFAAGAGAKEQKLANDSGADGVLSTPVDLNELMGIVKSINLNNKS